ncbi:MAG: hypothetical protein ACJ8F7_07880 [Gemmataceae bacterium]
MATTVRGKTYRAARQPSPVEVCPPEIDPMNKNRYLVDGGIKIEVLVAHGQKVAITLSREEEITFLAAFTERMKMRIDPPKPPQSQPRQARRAF